MSAFTFTLLSVGCTHYDWGGGSGGPVEDLPDASVVGNDELEAEVPYGERTPVQKEQTCKTDDFELPFSAPYVPSEQIRSQVASEVNAMTIDEKVQQMTGTDAAGGANGGDIFRQTDNFDRQIRGFKFRDGPRGLNLDAELRVQDGHTGYATAFPVSMARGATFDLDLEYRIGQAQGEETLASKHQMLLAPTVNLLRHAAWGRAQETYGEDPFLLGRMGTAYTVGVQEYLPACVKHFIANNVENGRGGSNSTMDEQTLREIYGRAYEMIIRDSGVACVMAAYNLVNGEKSTENQHLLTDVLRDDFGFEGFVMSDWWAMSNGQETNALAGLYDSVAMAGVTAGMDMELPWALNYRSIPTLVQGGQLSEAYVNTSVKRILEQKYRFKVGDRSQETYGLRQPEVGWDKDKSNIIDTGDQHLALAEEAAVKSAVLLKNESDTLPIDLPAGATVAVLGVTAPFYLGGENPFYVNYASDVITGDLGSSRVLADPARSVSPAAGIREAAERAGVNVVVGTTVAEAAAADYVIVVAGLNSGDEGEEYTGAGDRDNFALDGKLDDTRQNDLISDAAALKKPMAVVLVGGSVIDMPWLDEVPAVMMAWYPGMVGGRALGKLLFGETSPSGKLPITWPADWNDGPNFNPGVTVPMEYFAGYRFYEQQGTAPLYPFGYGLSYSTFEYLNLEVPCQAAGPDATVLIKVDVSNRGEVDAAETVFLFVSYPDSADERKRVKQVKGFYRVELTAGQTKQVTLPLRMNDLRFYDMAAERWVIESGQLQVSIQSDANNVLASPSGAALVDQITVVSN